ncbi:MAG: NAD(P)/FAD-dependent oxidoreductase [Candidatus Binatia bacterium]
MGAASVTEACDIAVIGAGAAGLAAGIFAAEAAGTGALHIVLLDGAEKIGAKILISGGGRCNVTHDEIHVADYNGQKPVVRNILAAFDERATVRWFGALGVELKREESGKLFPVSDQARTVLDALLRRCAELHVSVRAGRRVQTVDTTAGGFVVAHTRGRLRARRVVMATGGRSLARTGSDGSGWEIVRGLGHTVSETYPALVPLVLSRAMFHAELSGLSQPVELSTYADGKLIDRRTGSLLWTHFGISGPVVMDASRHWVIAQATQRRVEMRCSFVPKQRFEHVESWLIDASTSRPRLSLRKCLAAKVPERFATALAHSTGIDPVTPMAQLSREQRRALVHALTAFVLPIERARGWDYAEVTAGGVPLDEIDYRTMESRQVPGLYLIGEMLDCDGRIGGYNFQWAWATGYVAGRAAVRRLTSTGKFAPERYAAKDS